MSYSVEQAEFWIETVSLSFSAHLLDFWIEVLAFLLNRNVAYFKPSSEWLVDEEFYFAFLSAKFFD